MRERPDAQMIEASKIVIPETERIYGGLQDVRSGVRVAPELLQRTLSGEIKRVVFLGEPGNGKTVNLLQFAASFNRNAQALGVEKDVVVSQYDSFLNGKDDDTKEFNLRMYRSVRARERAHPYALSVVEVPAVGMTTGKNRGVEFMHLIAQESRIRKNNTAFVFLVTNGGVSMRAAYLRADIADMKHKVPDSRVPNDEIVAYLASHGIRLTNVPDHLGTYADLQEQFDNMAQRDHMRTIRVEEESGISDWALFQKNEYAHNLAKINHLPVQSSDMVEVLHEFGVSTDTETALGQAEHMAEKWVNSAREQAAFVMHRLEEMQVPEKNGYVVFNQYSKSDVELDYSVYGQQGLPTVM